MERIIARYELESPKSLEHAANVIAGEQSSGTFLKLASETDELRHRARARVEKVTETSTSTSASLPSRTHGNTYTRGEITLSWPLENMGTSLTNVLATVAGNLFELADVSALRLIDIEFPDAFAAAYPGPAFGTEGTLKLANVSGRPMIGTIIKPSVGLPPEDTAALVKQLIVGGIDFIKDDELQGNGSHCPLPARISQVMRVINDHADHTGKKPMYAFNITGEIDEMKRNADLVRDHSGTCAMVSLLPIGLAGLSAIRKHVELPLHCHRNGWGIYSRSPDIGISFRVWQKFWRLAGADHLHVNGIANKFTESDTTVIDAARSVSENATRGTAYHAMPVFSSGQTATQLAPTIAALGHTNFIYCAGGGIMGHPGGVPGGVASLRQAADAAIKGIEIDEYAKTHEALRTALTTFGGASK